MGRKDQKVWRKPWNCRICQVGDLLHPAACCGSVLPPKPMQASELRQWLYATSPWSWRWAWEKKHSHILCGCEQPSKRKVFCLFPRSKLVCRKSVSQTLTSHTSLFSFPNIFLHLLVTGSLKISKCFMQKGNLLFSMLFVSNRLLFIVNFWFILWQHEALNGK